MTTTFKPTARDVEVSTSQFEFAHGRQPRGNGGWAFSPDRTCDVQNPDRTFWFTGTFAQAKKAAQVWAFGKDFGFLHAQS